MNSDLDEIEMYRRRAQKAARMALIYSVLSAFFSTAALVITILSRR